MTTNLDTEPAATSTLGVVLDAASHDCKTALAVIVGNSTRIDEQRTNLNEKSLLASAKDVADEAAFLDCALSDLLLFLRISNGLISPDFQVFDFADAVQSALSCHDASLTGIRSKSWPIDHPLPVRGDRRLVEKAMFALVAAYGSSTKVTGQSEIRIAQSDRLATFSISGKPDMPFFQQLRRLLNPEPSDHHSDGAGRSLVLRLGLCHAIISMHSGSLSLSDQSRRRATAFLNLPCE